MNLPQRHEYVCTLNPGVAGSTKETRPRLAVLTAALKPLINLACGGLNSPTDTVKGCFDDREYSNGEWFM